MTVHRVRLCLLIGVLVLLVGWLAIKFANRPSRPGDPQSTAAIPFTDLFPAELPDDATIVVLDIDFDSTPSDIRYEITGSASSGVVEALRTANVRRIPPDELAAWQVSTSYQFKNAAGDRIGWVDTYEGGACSCARHYFRFVGGNPFASLHVDGPAIEQIQGTRDGRKSVWGVVCRLADARFTPVVESGRIRVIESKHGHDLTALMDWSVSPNRRSIRVEFKPGTGDFGTGNAVTVRVNRAAIDGPDPTTDRVWQIVTDLPTDVLH